MQIQWEGTNNKNNLSNIAGNSSLRQYKPMKDLRSQEQMRLKIRHSLAHMHPVTLSELEQDKPRIWPGEIGWKQRGARKHVEQFYYSLTKSDFGEKMDSQVYKQMSMETGQQEG